MKAGQIAERIAKLAWEKKGLDIVILDLQNLTDVSDYFVLISGETDTHVKAIYDYIENELRKENQYVWHKEGYQNLNWVLLDYIEVVAHIFKPHIREFYALEKLWGDARIIRVREDVPDRIILEK